MQIYPHIDYSHVGKFLVAMRAKFNNFLLCRCPVFELCQHSLLDVLVGLKALSYPRYLFNSHCQKVFTSLCMQIHSHELAKQALQR